MPHMWQHTWAKIIIHILLNFSSWIAEDLYVRVQTTQDTIRWKLDYCTALWGNIVKQTLNSRITLLLKYVAGLGYGTHKYSYTVHAIMCRLSGDVHWCSSGWWNSHDITTCKLCNYNYVFLMMKLVILSGLWYASSDSVMTLTKGRWLSKIYLTSVFKIL